MTTKEDYGALHDGLDAVTTGETKTNQPELTHSPVTVTVGGVPTIIEAKQPTSPHHDQVMQHHPHHTNLLDEDEGHDGGGGGGGGNDYQIDVGEDEDEVGVDSLSTLTQNFQKRFQLPSESNSFISLSPTVFGAIAVLARWSKYSWLLIGLNIGILVGWLVLFCLFLIVGTNQKELHTPYYNTHHRKRHHLHQLIQRLQISLAMVGVTLIGLTFAKTRNQDAPIYELE